MSITKQNIKELYEIIKNLYLEDDIPWVVGYSGGKDSTATLQLVWLALSELPLELRKRKAVHVICTDTLVESPVVAKWVEISLERMKNRAKALDMPIIPHRLIPDYNDTFWVNLLGRGYPFPHTNFRWCTDRLKIKPANTFVQNIVSSYGEVILLLGTRKAESANRARTMQHYENLRVRDFLSPNETMQNELVFSPLENWTNDDVWTFLMQYKNPWGHSNKDLLTMYRGATEDGECPLIINSDTPSCGKSRFGCWVCTLVEQDKSMAAMIMNDSEKEWMTPLLEFRNEIGDAEADRSRRDFRRMTGNTHMFKGRLVHGPYIKSVREGWLKKLLTIQTEINQNGPEEFRNLELITLEELNIIRQIWLDEKHEFDDSLPDIYKEVTGRDFVIFLHHLETSYGKAEWEILADVCHALYPDEKLLFEMTARIVDIEQKSSDIKQRKGILGDIEAQIKRGFFRDEEDAKAFTVAKVQRKKNMGAFYDKNAESEEEQLNFYKVEDN
ncbi:DNA phosphorothioation system sulfurtransferase DndC [Desulfitobacterium metallireducens]|uniref:Sulfurtransferase DndC n=1 Tax=Desulfitobacterium metallireducens DSM 15288 TaxID=871968 RepID=W0E9Z9_9FIRM|nr:DNA phosphorothioation system sulfurtransferase DndC [Desulfitobacterium metallireducens]AHF06059.1 sulfurtransferase DndC [Desulfitobacterium metallireducens DSM 15288]